MNSKNFNRIAAFTAALGLSSMASAAVSLVYTGTVASDATGTFSGGEAFTLTFTLSSDANAGGGQFSSTASANAWGTETTSQASTWASVTGTSLGGTWAEGSFDSADPRDALGVNDVGASDLFSFSTGIDSGTTVGLTLGGNEITSIQVSGVLDSFNATFSLGGYTDPSTYLNTFANTYTATSVSGTIQTGAGDLTINGTSLQITAIPEPSALGFFMVIATGLFVVRRRR